MKGNKKYHGFSENELFENEEEKNKILSMKDVEKEKIIADKINKLNHQKEIKELFNEKHEKLETKKKRGQISSSSNSESEESGEITKEEKKRSRRKKTSSENDDDVSSLALSLDENDTPKKEITPLITLDEIEKVKLNRKFFYNYFGYPIFKENVKGAFVRVNLLSTGKPTSTGSSGYIIGSIKEIFVKKDQPYNINEKKCNQYVKLTLPAHEGDYDYNVISNGNIQEEELKNWLENLEKDGQTPPSKEELSRIQKNIESIETYKFKDEELNQLINENRIDRIKYKDSSINITEELDLVTEKCRSLREKCEEYNKKKKEKNELSEEEERKEKEYLDELNEVEKVRKTLEKMKEERDKKAKMRSDNDIVAKINEDNKKRQKLDDIKNSLLQKKRRKEENSVFKRVDCHPSALFDSQLSKEESKEKELKKQKNEEVIKEKQNKKVDKKKNQGNYYIDLAKKIKNFKGFINDKKDMIDEMMSYEKSRAENKEEENKEKDKGSNENKEENANNKIDMSFFFQLASINYDEYYKRINAENKKNTLDPKVQIITLENLINKNKDNIM